MTMRLEGCDDRVAVLAPSGARAITFEWSPLAEALDEGLEAIVRAHWDEVGVHKDTVPLACDWDKYQELEDKDILKLMLARRGEKLVGYASYLVLPHLHYCTTLHASNDAIYVDPEERGLGIRLIRAAEKALVKFAAPHYIRILYHAKKHVEAERGTLSRVFEKLGYVAFETSHDKVLKKE